VALVEGVIGFGGGGHLSTPHDSTQGWAEQRFTVHTPAFFAWHIERTHCKPDPLPSGTIMPVKDLEIKESNIW
jgi:hypothetical protein